MKKVIFIFIGIISLGFIISSYVSNAEGIDPDKWCKAKGKEFPAPYGVLCPDNSGTIPCSYPKPPTGCLEED